VTFEWTSRSTLQAKNGRSKRLSRIYKDGPGTLNNMLPYHDRQHGLMCNSYVSLVLWLMLINYGDREIIWVRFGATFENVQMLRVQIALFGRSELATCSLLWRLQRQLWGAQIAHQMCKTALFGALSVKFAQCAEDRDWHSPLVLLAEMRPTPFHASITSFRNRHTFFLAIFTSVHWRQMSQCMIRP